MRLCFHHTDLEQNAVFHNFATQSALIQCSGRSIEARGLLVKPLKKIQNSLYMASRFSLLQSELWSCLNEH